MEKHLNRNRPEKKCCLERKKLRLQVGIMRRALMEIAKEDSLVKANPEAFSIHAFRRCQEQASAALRLTEE